MQHGPGRALRRRQDGEGTSTQPFVEGLLRVLPVAVPLPTTKQKKKRVARPPSPARTPPHRAQSCHRFEFKAIFKRALRAADRSTPTGSPPAHSHIPTPCFPGRPRSLADNLVNGTHSCGQGATMNSLLKKELNWTGFITSDWGAVHADGYEQAGLDMDQPGTDGFFAPAKLEADQAALDDMAARVITALITVDAFDNSVCVGGVNCTHFLYEANATSDAHAELARTIAAQSAALLKNERVVKTGEKVLPFRKGQTIGVVGDACDSKCGALDLVLGVWWPLLTPVPAPGRPTRAL